MHTAITQCLFVEHATHTQMTYMSKSGGRTLPHRQGGRLPSLAMSALTCVIDSPAGVSIFVFFKR